MLVCSFLGEGAKAGAAEPDTGVPACVVVLWLPELLLCPADCLQAEWAQRVSCSLATCEHSPPLLSNLTLNSFEDGGKTAHSKRSWKLSLVQSARAKIQYTLCWKSECFDLSATSVQPMLLLLSMLCLCSLKWMRLFHILVFLFYFMLHFREKTLSVLNSLLWISQIIQNNPEYYVVLRKWVSFFFFFSKPLHLYTGLHSCFTTEQGGFDSGHCVEFVSPCDCLWFSKGVHARLWASQLLKKTLQ